MVTLYFQKYFVRGNLKGITINETLPFATEKRAMIWVDAILKKEREKKLDFKLVHYTI